MPVSSLLDYSVYGISSAVLSIWIYLNLFESIWKYLKLRQFQREKTKGTKGGKNMDIAQHPQLDWKKKERKEEFAENRQKVLTVAIPVFIVIWLAIIIFVYMKTSSVKIKTEWWRFLALTTALWLPLCSTLWSATKVSFHILTLTLIDSR